MAEDINLAQPQVGALDLITQLQTYLANATVHLFKSAFSPTPQTVLTDLTAIEADYTGYGAKTIAAWTGPGLDSAGHATLLGSPATFIPTGTTITNDIYGGWVQSAGSVLELIFVFSAARPMGAVTDFINLTIAFQLPGPGIASLLD